MIPDNLTSHGGVARFDNEKRHIDKMINKENYNYGDIKKYLKTQNNGELYEYARNRLQANNREVDAKRLSKKITAHDKSKGSKIKTGSRTTEEKTVQLSPVTARSRLGILNDPNIRLTVYRWILASGYRTDNELIIEFVLGEIQSTLSHKADDVVRKNCKNMFITLLETKLLDSVSSAPHLEGQLRSLASQLFTGDEEWNTVESMISRGSVAPVSQNQSASVSPKTTREFAEKMLSDPSQTTLNEFAAAITSRHLHLFQTLSVIDFLRVDSMRMDSPPKALKPLESAREQLRDEILSSILSDSVVKFPKERKAVDKLIEKYLDLAGILYQQGDFLGADAVYNAVYDNVVNRVEKRLPDRNKVKAFGGWAIDPDKLHSAKRNVDFLNNLKGEAKPEKLDSLASDDRMLIPLVGVYVKSLGALQCDLYVWDDNKWTTPWQADQFSHYVTSLEKCIDKCQQKSISSSYQLVDDNTVIRVGNDPTALDKLLTIAVPLSIQDCEERLPSDFSLSTFMILALEPGYGEWAEKCLYALSWEYSPTEIISALSAEVGIINQQAANVQPSSPGSEHQLEQLAKKMEVAFKFLKSMASSHLILPSEWTPQIDGLVHDTMKIIVGGSDDAAAILTQEMKTACNESVSLVANRNATGRVHFADQMKAVLSKSHEGDFPGMGTALSELAQAMTFDEARLFEAIEPREFDRAKFDRADQAPNYLKFTQHWNQRNNEIAVSIVGDTVIPFGNLNDRIQLVKMYIQLAKELWKQGNLSSAFGVILILNNRCISKTMKTADPERAKELEKQISVLTQTFNAMKGGMALRELEKQFLAQNKPCIPAISAYTGIITSTGDLPRKNEAGKMVWLPFTRLGEQIKHLCDLTANVHSYSSKFTVNYFLEDLGNKYTSEKEIDEAYDRFALNLPREVSAGEYRDAVAGLELQIRTFVNEVVNEKKYRGERAALLPEEGSKQATLDMFINRSVATQAAAKQKMNEMIPLLGTQKCSDQALMSHYVRLSRDAARFFASQDIVRDCEEWKDSHRTLADLQSGILSANTDGFAEEILFRTTVNPGYFIRTLASLARLDPRNEQACEDLSEIISTFAMQCTNAAPLLGQYYTKTGDKYELNQAAAIKEGSPEVRSAVLMLQETCKTMQRQLDALEFRVSSPQDFGHAGKMCVDYMKTNVDKTLRNLGYLSSLLSA